MIENIHRIPTLLRKLLIFKKEEFLMKNSSPDQKKKLKVSWVIHLKHEAGANNLTSILQFKTKLLKKHQNFSVQNSLLKILMMEQTCNQTLMILINRMMKMRSSDLPMSIKLIYLDLKVCRHFEVWTWLLNEESFAQFLELLVAVKQQC